MKKEKKPNPLLRRTSFIAKALMMIIFSLYCFEGSAQSVHRGVRAVAAIHEEQTGPDRPVEQDRPVETDVQPAAIRSSPPMYGLSAGGITTDPSCC